MTHIDAAKKLGKLLDSSASVISVAAWSEGGVDSIVVFVSPNYRGHLSVPERFEGYPVEVRPRSEAKAYG